MSLTSWKGKVVRKQDIYIAKNYLTKDEIDILNRLVAVFLETAELRAKGRKDLNMKFWRENVDKIISFNEKPLLRSAGSVSKSQMEETVNKIYEEFNARRKREEANQADIDDLEELKRLGDNLKSR